MRSIYSRENLLGTYKAEINCVRALISAFEDIKQVVEKFDGKMMNVKVENAINEVVKYCSVRIHRNEYNSETYNIIVFCNDRQQTIIDSFGNETSYYAKTFEREDLTYIKMDGEKHNKINVKGFNERIDKELEYLNSQLILMTKNSEIETIIDMEKEQEELREIIRNFNRSLDHINGQYFDI